MLVRELLMDRNHQSMLNEKDREKLTFLRDDFNPSHLESPQKYILFMAATLLRAL